MAKKSEFNKRVTIEVTDKCTGEQKYYFDDQVTNQKKLLRLLKTVKNHYDPYPSRRMILPYDRQDNKIKVSIA